MSSHLQLRYDNSSMHLCCQQSTKKKFWDYKSHIQNHYWSLHSIANPVSHCSFVEQGIPLGRRWSFSSKSVSLNMISFSLKRYSWPWTESILTGISHLTSSDKANQILASEFSSKDTGRLFAVSPARCLNVEQYHHHCCQQCHCLGRAINPFPGHGSGYYMRT